MRWRLADLNRLRRALEQPSREAAERIRAVFGVPAPDQVSMLRHAAGMQITGAIEHLHAAGDAALVDELLAIKQRLVPTSTQKGS